MMSERTTDFKNAVNEIFEWLLKMTYDFDITRFEYVAEHDLVTATVVEYDNYNLPANTYLFHVNTLTGVLYNENNDDVIDVAQEAYSNDDEMIEWLRDFDHKWYKKEGTV